MASPGVATANPRVLIFVPPLVRRLKHFIRLKSGGNNHFALNFDLAQRCVVSMLGIGGRTVDKMMRYDLHSIWNYAPEVVVLELGSNDFCDKTVDGHAVALVRDISPRHSCIIPLYLIHLPLLAFTAVFFTSHYG